MFDVSSLVRGKTFEAADALVSSRAHAEVVISGFWRSGTTWLQQMVADGTMSKSVFEPLDPRHLPLPVALELAELLATSPRAANLPCFTPFYAAAESLPSTLRSYLLACGQGRPRGYRLRRARTSLSESFRRSVNIKFVRGQLMLPALSSLYDVPVIHIKRDPRAVLASIRRANWWANWLENVSLKKLVLEPGDDRGDTMEQWSELIKEYDRRPPLPRLAVYWFILEHHAHLFLASSNRAVGLQYEQLTMDPAVLSRALTTLGMKCDPAKIRGTRNSPTTGNRSQSNSQSARCERWRYELSSLEIAEVDQALHDCRLAVDATRVTPCSEITTK